MSMPPYLKGRIHADAFYFIFNENGIFDLNPDDDDKQYPGYDQKTLFQFCVPLVFLSLAESHVQTMFNPFSGVP